MYMGLKWQSRNKVTVVRIRSRHDSKPERFLVHWTAQWLLGPAHAGACLVNGTYGTLFQEWRANTKLF